MDLSRRLLPNSQVWFCSDSDYPSVDIPLDCIILSAQIRTETELVQNTVGSIGTKGGNQMCMDVKHTFLDCQLT